MPRATTPGAALRLLAVLAALLLLPVAPAAAATPTVPDYGPAIDAYAHYEAETGCFTPTVWPGTQKLRDFLAATYSGHSFLLDRPCSASASGHEEGRSIDMSFDARQPAQLAGAGELITWLLATDRYGNANALVRRMGVMYIIWNGRMWRAYNPSAGWTEYSKCLGDYAGAAYDTTCHRDHIHFSLSWAGAKATTSFYAGPLAPPEEPPGPVSRLAGPDRYATSVAIGREAFPTSTTVVIASGETGHLVDGLVAAPLAYQLGAPVLLGTARGLPTPVLADITARHAVHAVLVGSADVLGSTVVDQLVAAGVPSAAIERVGGLDRYQTAAKAAARMGGTGAVVASGDNRHLVDALAAGGPAARLGLPILLTSASSLPSSTATALAGRTSVVVAGGADVVEPSVLARLPQGTVQVGGTDRYDTAASLATHFAGSVTAPAVVLGSGAADHMVDALPGGALGALTLLTEPTSASGATLSWLTAARPDSVVIVGGTPAVSAGVATQVRDLLTATQ